MSAYNQYGMAPFNGKSDFSIWKQKIKCILIQQKCFKAVGETYLISDTEDKRAEMNENACSVIYLNLSDSVIRKVGILESAKVLWNKLNELYTETSLPNRIFLLEKFFKFRLDMSIDIEENLDVFTKLISDIKLCGDKHIDDYSPIALLNAIPDSFSDVKSAIKYGRDNVTLDIVVNGLKSKELDLKQMGEGRKSEEVMHVRGRENNSRRHRSKSRSNSRRCYYCHESGHFIRDCPKSKKNEHSEHANLTTCVDDLGDVLMMKNLCDYDYLSSVISDSLCKSDWVVDSGCSFHMSPMKNVFSNYREIEHGFVFLANEKKCNVLGIGDVCLRFSSGYVLTLKNVRHVPELCCNLLSCASLENEGLKGKWGKGIMKVVKGCLVVFKAEMKNNLYVCHAEPLLDSVNCVQPCVLGKQSRVGFPDLPKCTNVLDCIHADLWGPYSVSTHGGKNYFLTFIDDFSKKVWVLLIENKSEVFDKFKNWKTLVEKQTGKKINFLRTTVSFDFCDDQLGDLCDTWGISMHKSVPSTPQPDGVAERMVRTLLERVRAMLASSGLSNKFWGEAICYAVDLINLSPSVPLEGKCPESVFMGKPLNLPNLRVFGCLAYVNCVNDKSEPRTKEYVFLGYHDCMKGYRLWCRSETCFNVLMSRNVIFVENEFPCLLVSPDVAPNEVEHLPDVHSDLLVETEPKFVDENVFHGENKENNISIKVEHDMNVMCNMLELRDCHVIRDRDIMKHVRNDMCNVFDYISSEFALNVLNSLLIKIFVIFGMLFSLCFENVIPCDYVSSACASYRNNIVSFIFFVLALCGYWISWNPQLLPDACLRGLLTCVVLVNSFVMVLVLNSRTDW
ncbi:unnamed protein product [Cuscuta epithymum]|uniref:Uncharacterized protein n=1 Tax=Cuscuta epithymum TaxID=186058 RepID=A0AAV0CUE9_9ASTE|nr:unnamed protein product [Cuscuta epithymum]